MLTPETVRSAGAPHWSPTGELAAGAFDGIRRGIVLIDPDDGAARWWSRPASASNRLLALPPGTTGPHPLLVFLHGGPVGALACGEHPDVSAWAASGWAVFMPDLRSRGIAGRDEMRRAFRRRGLPGQDPETGDVLSGVDLLTVRGLADPGALILFGHSYGGYLAGRIIAREHRFRVAVCCEAVADLRSSTR